MKVNYGEYGSLAFFVSFSIVLQMLIDTSLAKMCIEKKMNCSEKVNTPDNVRHIIYGEFCKLFFSTIMIPHTCVRRWQRLDDQFDSRYAVNQNKTNFKIKARYCSQCLDRHYFASTKNLKSDDVKFINFKFLKFCFWYRKLNYLKQMFENNL